MNTPAQILLPTVTLRPEWLKEWQEPTDDVQPLDAPGALSAGSTAEMYSGPYRFIVGEIARRES
ncbi:MAG: hypothetical protein KGL35_07755 [Bradyrhizobium sp.]|nr:hypothetical protein [Bradyrhizobium sp.]